MSTPEFILSLREKIGHDPLWLPGVKAVVLRAEDSEVLLVRRADNGRWTVPAGIPDPGEAREELRARLVATQAALTAWTDLHEQD